MFQFVKSIFDSNPLPYSVSVSEVMNSKFAFVNILSALLSQSKESVNNFFPSFDSTLTFPKALI